MATTQTTAAVGMDVKQSVFPPFDTTTFGSQLLWLAITFGFLYLVMSKVLVPRLTRIVETRDAVLSRDLDEAKLARDQAEAEAAAYEKALKDARTSANHLARETKMRLTAASDARRKSIEAELNHRLAEAELTIAARKTEAMTHVRSIAFEAAANIIEKVTGQPASASALDQALDGPRQAA